MIPDSAERVNKGFGLTGKTEQLNTRGVNLWRSDSTVIVSGTKYLMFDNPIQTGTYTLSAIFANDKSASESLFTFYNEQNQSMGGGTIKQGGRQSKTFTLTGKAVKVLFYASSGYDSSQGVTTTIKEIQLETGTTATPYEPYTGGKPSPSPEYPQEIKSVGKWNEGKQKYEVDVKVTGKNLFNREKAKDVSNWISIEGDGYLKFPIRAKKGSMITFSYEEKLTEGKKFYLGIAKKETGSVIAWLYHDVNLSVSNSKYTIVSEEGYVYLMCNKNAIQNFLDAIQTLQVEISQTQTEYEPYKEQTLTITSDRPITKWDRLIEQGGEIGWLYSTKKYTVTGNENYAFGDSRYYSGISTNMYINAVKNMSGEGVCRRLKSIIGIWDKSNNTKDGFCINSGNQIHMRFFNNLLGVSDDATMEEKKRHI